MAAGEEWLYRPVHRGMVTMSELNNCAVDLADLAAANEYLDVYEENQFRLQEAMKE